MNKKFHHGFGHLKPLDVSSGLTPEKQNTNACSQLKKYKTKLANKVINNKTLTISEKEDIYRYLTDKEPPYIKCKGRESTEFRDMRIAIDFLFQRKTQISTDKLMDTLREYDERPGKKISDNAIYSAIDRGVSALIKHNVTQIGIDYDNGHLPDFTDSVEDLKKKAKEARELYFLIEEYIEQKEQRRKQK